MNSADPPAEPEGFVERRHGSESTGLDRSRSSGLDGLRAFAALFVVAFHLKTVSGVGFGPLDPIVLGGDTGVWLFFALSGYLLYKPFLRGTVDLTGYAAKRAGRILPGYFVALAGLTIMTGNALPLQHPLPYLTMSASYDIGLRGFLGNAWTLSAEIVFYLTLPLIARAAHGREIAVLATLAILSGVLGIAQRVFLSEGNLWLTGSYPIVFYTFVPGMFLAVLEVRHPARFDNLGRWPLFVIGAGLIAFGALTSTLPLALATGVGTALVMAWLLHHPLAGAPYLAFAGGASYAVYLWHKDAFIAFGPLVGLVVALVASALSWSLVERPILARVHALDARRRQRASAGQRGEPVAVPVP